MGIRSANFYPKVALRLEVSRSFAPADRETIVEAAGAPSKTKAALLYRRPISLPRCPYKGAALMTGPSGEQRQHIKIAPPQP